MAFIDDDETLQAFKEESHEHLDGIESDLLAIEEAGANIDLELVNKVFRAMHSIKGGAGFLGLNAVKTLAHAAEDLLNKIRNKELVPTAPVISSLLDAADLVNRLLNQPKGAVELDISGPLSSLNNILFPAPKAQPDSNTIACGPLDSGEQCEEIRETLRQTIAAGSTSLVLDLQNANEIVPSGIYLLLAARHSLEKKGGLLTFANAGEKIRQLCIMLRLDAILGV